MASSCTGYAAFSVTTSESSSHSRVPIVSDIMSCDHTLTVGLQEKYAQFGLDLLKTFAIYVYAIECVRYFFSLLVVNYMSSAQAECEVRDVTLKH